MDVSTHRISQGGDFGGPHPILVIASSEMAARRASKLVEAAGYRAEPTSLERAADRIQIQVAASAVWLELDADPGPLLDQLIDEMESKASSDGWPGIIAAPFAMLDALDAKLKRPEIELLIDPSAAESAAALAKLAVWSSAWNSTVNDDVSRDSGDVRLRQLSDEISRIAATLARLSTGPGPGPVEKPQTAGAEAPPVSLDTVRQVIRARRLRARYFDEEIFADPAWDMLLDLLQAEIAQHRVPVSSLCIAASVPATTALRWIKSMTDAGLFKRRADPHDGRRVFVELSATASEAMRRYFREVGNVAVV